MIALVPEQEHTIFELAQTICEVSEVNKGIELDTTKADGQYRKTMGNKIMRDKLPNFAFTSLKEGLRETVQDYRKER